MRQRRKGENSHLGMTRRGAVDALGLAHSVHTTPANQANIDAAPRLLHGDQRTVWADAGCQGLEQRPGHKDRPVPSPIALRQGRRTTLAPNDLRAMAEKVKDSVRAKIEHPFCHIQTRWCSGMPRCATAGWRRPQTGCTCWQGS